jgi:hypothetical protein
MLNELDVEGFQELPAAYRSFLGLEPQLGWPALPKPRWG